MGAKLIKHNKKIYHDGSITEIKIWQVPKSERLSSGYKYSLVYIKEGKRVIGYDNAEGKGNHRHYGDYEEAYNFINLSKVFSDFLNDVQKVKEGQK